MQRYPFVTDETPHCIWDWDLQERNLRFLRGIDADYYRHMADSHGGVSEGEDRHRAALALRLGYSHAMETFFALVGAAVQAPQCPLGWVLRYKNTELHNVISKIHRRQHVYARIDAPLTWDSLSRTFLQFTLEDSERADRIKHWFATAWSRLAHDFIDRAVTDEYNGIKHGLRVRPGGFSLSVGIEPSPGVSPPPEEMGPWLGSDYGSSYYTVEYPANAKYNFRARRSARNWNPDSLAYGLLFLSTSIKNVVSYLMIAGGVPGSMVKFEWFPDEADYHKPWESSPSLRSFNGDTIVSASDIEPMTKEQILSTYAK
jgi:hypothetical protein